MRSFYFKNFIILAGSVMLSLIILGASFVLVGRNRVLAARQDALESNVIELSRLASAYARDSALGNWNFRIILSSIARSTGNHCFPRPWTATSSSAPTPSWTAGTWGGASRTPL